MFSDSVLGLFIILCWIFPFRAVTQQGSPHISRSASASHPKVFVIGLPQTGTTSVGDALELLSYQRTGGDNIRSRFLFHAYNRGDLAFLYDHTFDFDAFHGLPWSLVYRDMALLYPDAKFILTLRVGEDAWLESMKRHTNHWKCDGHELVYGAEEASYNEEVYLNVYRNHTDSVRTYFASLGQDSRWLEFVIDKPDISKGEKWSRLCEFLGLSDGVKMAMRQLEFPHSNDTPIIQDDHRIPSVFEKMKSLFQVGLAKTVRGLVWLTAAAI